jgi:protein-tyrosine phosphatase
MAEGIFTHLVDKAGLSAQISCDSAGTSNYHIGELPDYRTIKIADKYGVPLPTRARQVEADDFKHFDYIMAMDRNNLLYLKNMADKLPESSAELSLYRHYDTAKDDKLEVADPYYGDMKDFEICYSTLYRCGEAFLEELKKTHGL